MELGGTSKPVGISAPDNFVVDTGMMARQEIRRGLTACLPPVRLLRPVFNMRGRGGRWRRRIS